MLRGFYTAASGMITQQRHQEVLSNNIANVSTPGYKADETVIRSFPELLMNEIGNKNVPTTRGLNFNSQRQVGPLHTGTYVQEVIPAFDQGGIKETGIPTDVALVAPTIPDEAGSLFFTVQNSDGEIRFTRNGNFTVDGAGMLVTTEGYYVLDEANNPIFADGLEFTISKEGLIEVDGQTTQLGVSYVADTSELVKEGDNLFNGEAGELPPGINYSVEQGYLEHSNVDSGRTMVEMMESYRVYEMNQRVLKAYDESMGKAVSEIGRLG